MPDPLLPIAPTALPALSDPPSWRDPDNFDDRADAHVDEVVDLVPRLNASNANVYHNAQSAVQHAVVSLAGAAAAGEAVTAAQEARDLAQTSAAQFALLREHFLGVSAVDLATRPGGAALQAGDWYINTGSGNVRAYNGVAWVAGIASVAGVSSFNGLVGDVLLPRLVTHDNRAALRANETWGHALVDGLGWFRWTVGSTEPDDDESCFATAAGRWLLELPSWDVVSAWLAPVLELVELLGRTRNLRGTGLCAISSLAAGATAAFTASIGGASQGDQVLVTPPAALGSTDSDSARLSYHAYVSADSVVTVRLVNPSGSTANLNPAVQVAWPITVVKEL